jgi:alkylation response protein AidB-like acyl-CoA dehydrogenase
MDSRYFTAEHEAFRKTVRGFVEKELIPRIDEWEEREEIPREIFSRMGQLGFFGLRFPEEYGGSGADFFFSVVFAEELARCGSGGLTSSIMVQSDMVTPIIYRLGTEEQKQHYLIPGIKGEKLYALGITEPNAGSDVSGIQTYAVRDGDEYIINGSKIFISNGCIADCVMLAVKTDKQVKGSRGISLFLVDKERTGFSVGRKLRKMGRWCSDTAELSFEDCRVPRSSLLGKEGEGFYQIMDHFQGERLLIAVRCVSMTQKVLEDTVKYAQERIQFGQPIGKFQAIRHMLADMSTEVEAARQLTYYAAWLYNQGFKAVKEISMAKLFATEMANRVTNNALQIHGGYGYMLEYSVQRVFRDLRCESIGGGTSQIQREIIGKELGV